MDSGDIVLMMRSKNPDMLALFFSLPFLLELLTHHSGKEKIARGREIFALKRPGFFAVLSNSTMPLAGHSRPGFVMPYQFLQPYTTPLLDFFFFFFVSASSLFQKPNPSAQKYIYLHKKDLRQQVISKLSTLRGQNAHGILDCRCSSARCRRQGGCALLTSFVVLLWG